METNGDKKKHIKQRFLLNVFFIMMFFEYVHNSVFIKLIKPNNLKELK